MKKLVVTLPVWLLLATSALAQNAGWPVYGATAAGTRYSGASQITPANVARLQPVWIFHTDIWKTLPKPMAEAMKEKAAFEATPVLDHGTLYLTTPTDEVIALDAVTGTLRWRHQPTLARLHYSEVSSRGVALWQDEHGNGTCARRVFLGTLDGELLALDAATGRSCVDFGDHGVVSLTRDVDLRDPGNYQITSPPTVIGDRVIVGSSIGDNRAVSLERGVVRAYDARSGRLVWTWDPIPWAAHQQPRTGAANAWSIIAADPAHDLVFVPTGSPSPDYYGGDRPGDDADANSVVALRASTGRKAWAFQLTHHDLWDFDVAAEPLLFTWKDGTPAIAITNKSGNVFVLDRLTGKPLVPVTEREVPRSDVPGEHASSTQPFSALPPLAPQTPPIAADIFALNDADRAACAAMLKGARAEGIYTPPSLAGTLTRPGNIGGVNWGSAAYDPVRHLYIADVNTLVAYARLIPRAQFTGALSLGRQNRDVGEFAPQSQTPYGLYRTFWMARGQVPCSQPPWGTVTAINLFTGKLAWRVPLGSLVPGQTTGSPNLGGPIVTAGGLVFTAATMDDTLRAFDASTGRLVWSAPLPAGGQATPMSYEIDGRQYLVICAGGHGKLGTKLGDAVIAYALPEK